MPARLLEWSRSALLANVVPQILRAACENKCRIQRDDLDRGAGVGGLDDLSAADVHRFMLARVSKEDDVTWF